MKTMTCVAALLLLLPLALPVHAEEEDEPEEPPKQEKPKLPWDLDAIRDSFAWGMAFTYDHERTGKPKDQLRYEFMDNVDGEVSKLRVQISEKGVEKPDKRKSISWEAHIDDLTDFLERATVTQAELSLGDKKYSCSVLSQSEGEDRDKVTRTAWYAKEVPGLWVRYLFERSKSVETYTLTKAEPMYHNPGWKLSQIASALKDGVSAKYKVTTDKGDVTYVLQAFGESTETEFKETVTTFDKDGKQTGEPKSVTAYWGRYFRNFLYLRAASKMSDTSVEIGGEKIACLKVTQEETFEGGTQITDTLLSPKHPGIAIGRVVTTKTKDSETRRIVELVELKIGK